MSLLERVRGRERFFQNGWVSGSGGDHPSLNRQPAACWRRTWRRDAEGQTPPLPRKLQRHCEGAERTTSYEQRAAVLRKAGDLWFRLAQDRSHHVDRPRDRIDSA